MLSRTALGAIACGLAAVLSASVLVETCLADDDAYVRYERQQLVAVGTARLQTVDAGKANDPVAAVVAATALKQASDALMAYPGDIPDADNDLLSALAEVSLDYSTGATMLENCA